MGSLELALPARQRVFSPGQHLRFYCCFFSLGKAGLRCQPVSVAFHRTTPSFSLLLFQSGESGILRFAQFSHPVILRAQPEGSPTGQWGNRSLRCQPVSGVFHRITPSFSLLLFQSGKNGILRSVPPCHPEGGAARRISNGSLGSFEPALPARQRVFSPENTFVFVAVLSVWGKRDPSLRSVPPCHPEGAARRISDGSVG